jgi:hypothetical protein
MSRPGGLARNADGIGYFKKKRKEHAKFPEEADFFA